MRREFTLRQSDERFLNARGRPWEAILAGAAQWVLLHEFELPRGYSVRTTSVAVELISGYPSSPLDMAYFLPALARADGKVIPQTTVHALDGKEWQRWSRHRTPANPWRESEDDLSTHVAYVSVWLEDEFRKRP